jgi:hypothetical protein
MTGTVTEIFSLGLHFCVDGAVKAGMDKRPARMGREENRKEPKMEFTITQEGTSKTLVLSKNGVPIARFYAGRTSQNSRFEMLRRLNRKDG